MFEATYQQVGFSGLRMQAQVDEEQAAQSLAAFEAQKAAQTAKMAQAAAEVVKRQAAKQKQEPTNGPVQMGRQLKMSDPPQQMVTITQEERSVTVEGYVFDVEVRELRSKRQLLIFKITDYSSSFIAKKFSNGADDEAMFARIKKASGCGYAAVCKRTTIRANSRSMHKIFKPFPILIQPMTLKAKNGLSCICIQT